MISRPQTSSLAPRACRALACLLALAAPAAAQTMNDRTAATKNTQWLRDALAARQTVRVPAGTLYVNGAAETPATVGCGRIESDGCRSYPTDNHPTLTGQVARVVQLGSGPIFRVRGHGFTVADPLELVGDGRSAAIEIESARPVPNTGGHFFAHVTFQNWAAAFRACGDPADGHADLHADNTLVSDCHAYRCQRFFWSQNQQAVNWKLRDCSVHVLGGGDLSVVVCDIERGGNVIVDGLVICHPRTTLFRVRDFSPNSNRLLCRDFERDRFPREQFPDNYLTLVEHTGGDVFAWEIEIAGKVLPHFAPIDAGQLYKVPAALPRGKWTINVSGLE